MDDAPIAPDPPPDPQPSIPAGWYPDPEAPQLRWWTGTAWSDETRPADITTGPTAQEPVARAPRSWLSKKVIWGVGAGVGALLIFFYALGVSGGGVPDTPSGEAGESAGSGLWLEHGATTVDSEVGLSDAELERACTDELLKEMSRIGLEDGSEAANAIDSQEYLLGCVAAYEEQRD